MMWQEQHLPGPTHRQACTQLGQMRNASLAAQRAAGRPATNILAVWEWFRSGHFTRSLYQLNRRQGQNLVPPDTRGSDSLSLSHTVGKVKAWSLLTKHVEASLALFQDNLSRCVPDPT